MGKKECKNSTLICSVWDKTSVKVGYEIW